MLDLGNALRERQAHRMVQHKADVSLVDAESERNGGANNFDLALSPSNVQLLLRRVAHIAMIYACLDDAPTLFSDTSCYCLGVLLAQTVYDAAVSSVILEDVVGHGFDGGCGGRGLGDNLIMQVLAVEWRREVAGPLSRGSLTVNNRFEAQSSEKIFENFGGTRGRECEDRHVGKELS